MVGRRAIGVDLGGTKILAGVVDADGGVHATRHHETPSASQEALVEALEGIVSELRSPEVGAVGIAVPARVDAETGVAFGAVNAALQDLPLRDEMARRIGLPVGVANDAGAAVLAELRYGAAKGANDVVLLTLGTGVGGGVILGGELYRGWAELGHMVIVEGGEPCQGTCTGRGHVESYCSGTAADRIAERVLGPGSSAEDLVGRGHPALEQVGTHLGTAIGSLVNIFGPELVLVGGGFGVGAGELLLGPAREALAREALAPGGEVRVALAGLGADAGMVGAALLGFDALDAEEALA
jgi:glucokinase